VCTTCGVALDDQLFDSREAYTHTRNKDRISTHQPLVELGTTLGKSSERNPKFNRLQTFQSRSVARIDRLCVDFKYKIKALKSTFHIEMDESLFVTEFKKIYPKLPARIKCRNMNIFSTSIFIRVCRAAKMNIDVKAILAEAEISMSDFFASYQTLTDPCINTTSGIKIFNLNSRLAMDYKLIQGYVADNHLGQAFYDQTVAFLNSSYLKLGTKPAIRVCSALAVIAQTHPEYKIKPYHIARSLHVSMSRIYSIMITLGTEKSVHEPVVKVKVKPNVKPNGESIAKASERSIAKPIVHAIAKPIETHGSHSPVVSIQSRNAEVPIEVVIKPRETKKHFMFTSNTKPIPAVPKGFHLRSRLRSNCPPMPSESILRYASLSKATSRTSRIQTDRGRMATRLRGVMEYFTARGIGGPPKHPSCWQIIRQLQREATQWPT